MSKLDKFLLSLMHEEENHKLTLDDAVDSLLERVKGKQP